MSVIVEELAQLATVNAYDPSIALPDRWIRNSTNPLSDPSLPGSYTGQTISNANQEFVLMSGGTDFTNGSHIAANIGNMSGVTTEHVGSAVLYAEGQFKALAEKLQGDPNAVNSLTLTGHSLGYADAQAQLARLYELANTSGPLQTGYQLLFNKTTAFGINGTGVASNQTAGIFGDKAVNIITNGDLADNLGKQLGVTITLEDLGSNVPGIAAGIGVVLSGGATLLVFAASAIGGLAANHPGSVALGYIRNRPGIGGLEVAQFVAFTPEQRAALGSIDPFTLRSLGSSDRQAMIANPVIFTQQLKDNGLTPVSVTPAEGGGTCYVFEGGTSYIKTMANGAESYKFDPYGANPVTLNITSAGLHQYVFSQESAVSSVTELPGGEWIATYSNNTTLLTRPDGSGKLSIYGEDHAFSSDDKVSLDADGNWVITSANTVAVFDKTNGASIVYSYESGQLKDVSFLPSEMSGPTLLSDVISLEGDRWTEYTDGRFVLKTAEGLITYYDPSTETTTYYYPNSEGTIGVVVMANYGTGLVDVINVATGETRTVPLGSVDYSNPLGITRIDGNAGNVPIYSEEQIKQFQETAVSLTGALGKPDATATRSYVSIAGGKYMIVDSYPYGKKVYTYEEGKGATQEILYYDGRQSIIHGALRFDYVPTMGGVITVDNVLNGLMTIPILNGDKVSLNSQGLFVVTGEREWGLNVKTVNYDGSMIDTLTYGNGDGFLVTRTDENGVLRWQERYDSDKKLLERMDFDATLTDAEAVRQWAWDYYNANIRKAAEVTEDTSKPLLPDTPELVEDWCNIGGPERYPDFYPLLQPLVWSSGLDDFAPPQIVPLPLVFDVSAPTFAPVSTTVAPGSYFNQAQVATYTPPPTPPRCFAGGTPILLADGATKPIARIEVGDTVMAFDGLGELVPASVTRTYAYDPAEVTELAMEGLDEPIVATHLHRFLTADGTYKPLGTLTSGERLVAADGNPIVLKSLTSGAAPVPVYNFTVENLHSYIAGGLRVHNQKPIVIDLDGDNKIELIGLDESGVFFDMDEDGFKEHTAWVAADDGILAWDREGDGRVTNAREFVFALYGQANASDLEGLRAAFDTNGDLVLDANDVEFAKFGVWRDANQNGVSEAGEFKTLSDLGISSISLISDGVQAEENGNLILGKTSFVRADGSSGVAADVDFADDAAGFAETRRLPYRSELINEAGEKALAVVEGATVRTMNVGLGDARIGFGSSGNDWLLAAGTDGVTLVGGAGNDVLIGGASDDILKGGLGTDAMFGGGGNDTLYIDAADSTQGLDGGTGLDVARVAGLDAVSLDLGATHIEAAVGNVGNDHFFTSGTGKIELSGGAGNDVLEGGAGNDVLIGGAGADTLFGGAGDDTLVIDAEDAQGMIDAGEGNDTVLFADKPGIVFDLGAAHAENGIGGGEADHLFTSGAGAVRIGGEGGDDIISGGASGDTLAGGEGNDLIAGGDGDDSLGGGAGDDRLMGGAGNDILIGGAGSDSLDGGDGDDILVIDADDRLSELRGGAGEDAAHVGDERGVSLDLGATEIEAAFGNSGNDHFFTSGVAGISADGGAGDDTLAGGAGNDQLLGGTGRDFLDGGAGQDNLVGGAGADRLLGGAGDDVLMIDGEDVNADIDGGDGRDTVLIQDSAGVFLDLGLSHVEEAQGGEGNDRLYTSGSEAISAFGGAGNDQLLGGVGDDVLSGGAGTDVLRGGAGDDRLIIDAVDRQTDIDGGAGRDTVIIEGATGRVFDAGAANVEIVQGSDGVDQLFTSGAGAVDLRGGAGDDVLTGSIGADTLTGGAGSDTLIGGAGDDTLVVDRDDLAAHIDGGDGSDEIQGGSGKDTLNGGAGGDFIAAGTSADYVYGGADNAANNFEWREAA